MNQVNDLTQGMTDRQTAATLHWGRPAAVSAGAGAGKTKVLTARVGLAIQKTQAPESVVAITFTNDAASEMRSRVIDLVGKSIGGQCVITTFHSFAMNHVLKPFWNHPFLKSLGCTGKTLNIEFSNLTLNHLRKSSRGNALSRQQDSHLSELTDNVDAEFQSWLSLVRSYGYTPMSYFDNLESNFATIDELCRFYEKLQLDDATSKDYINHYFLKCWVHYDGLLREKEAIDFDQVLVFSMMLLEHDSTVRRKLKARFKVFLVDEFQDTNVCQYRFILQLVGTGENFSLFGDIKQAIYSFRGSSCYLMANIANQFSDIEIFNLPDNFRSTSNVVSVGNKIAEQMGVQLVREPMIPHKQSQVKPTFRQFANEDGEATWVADKILELKGQGIKPQDIGILYRFNKTGQGMENFLISRNIPYRRIGTDKGLYEEDDIRDIVIFLHLLYHPYANNVLKFIFAMFPQFGVSGTALSEAMKSVRASGGGKVNNHQVLTFIYNNNLYKPVCAPQLKALIQLIIDLSGLTQRVNTFEDFCRHLNEHYSNLDETRKKVIEDELGDRFWQSRRETISKLCKAYTQRFRSLFGGAFFATETAVDLATKNFGLVFNASFETALSETNFLQYVCSRPLIDKVRSNKEDENTSDVELMTIHASKGLEKQAIFVIGSSEQSWWRDTTTPSSGDAYEEEMRLFYVALTRAIEHLSFTFSATREYNRKLQRCYPVRFGAFLDTTVEYYNHVDSPPSIVDGIQDFIDTEL